MKAFLAFTLSLTLASPTLAFDNGRFGSAPAVMETTTKPTNKQFQKCSAKYPQDFCQDIASFSTSEEFEEILDKLHVELTAANAHF